MDINKSRSKIYKAFGLSICSDIPFEELIPTDNINLIDVDIIISQEELMDLNNDFLGKSYGFLIKDKQVMCKFLNVGVFSIKEGNKIIVYPLKDYREDIARSVILGTCMGVILLQRKILPLHGSAFYIDGKAYAIIGDSGVGKSTLASVFLNLGFELLTDDVIAVTFSESNDPIIIPSYPQQKLWENSLIEFKMDFSKYTSLFKREKKYAVPVKSKFLDFPAPLEGIFELKKEDGDKLKIDQLNGLERLSILYENTYRNLVIPPLDLLNWHFETSTRLLQSVVLNRISRPIERFTAFEIADLILNKIKGGTIHDYYKSSRA